MEGSAGAGAGEGAAGGRPRLARRRRRGNREICRDGPDGGERRGCDTPLAYSSAAFFCGLLPRNRQLLGYIRSVR